MKITKQRLQKIIQEELQGILLEQRDTPPEQLEFDVLDYLPSSKLPEKAKAKLKAGERDDVTDAWRQATLAALKAGDMAPAAKGDAAALAAFKARKEKPAAPAGAAPGGAVDPKVAALQKKAAAGDITSKQILRQYKKQQARKAGGV